MFSKLHAWLGFEGKSGDKANFDTPDFFPASPEVFDYQRTALARTAANLGRTPHEILEPVMHFGKHFDRPANELRAGSVDECLKAIRLYQ